MAVQFLLNEEQGMLRESARRWIDARDPREAEDFDQAWAYFAEMGWLMAGVPEEAGGLGGTTFDSAIIAEELGRGLIRAPFVEVGVVAARLLLALDAARVEAITLGEARPILAHEEADAGGDPSWVETRAERDGDDWRLTGRKSAIVGAPHATSFLISARIEGEGIALFEMAAEDAPLRAFRTMDDRPGGELVLDASRATLIAGSDRALPAIRQALDHGLVAESAAAVGAMQKAMEIARDYLLTRKQYGQVLADFQALRHRLADMFVEIENARSIVFRGLDALGSGNEAERSAAASAAFSFTARAGLFVGGNAIQLHGGIGVTDEYPVGHFYKHLVTFNQRHGTGPVHVERFAGIA